MAIEKVTEEIKEDEIVEEPEGLPVDVSVEGEEEVGSPNISSFIKQNGSLLSCDTSIVLDTPIADLVSQNRYINSLLRQPDRN